MAQSEHESSINWNGYAKIAIRTTTKLSEAHIEESSVYALLVPIELFIPSIDKQERLLFTMLDIGAAFINIDVKCAIYLLQNNDRTNKPFIET